MPARSRRLPILAIFTLAALPAVGALAGPLDPPPPPIAPSMKPLSEVEPRTAINAANTPGSVTSVFVISQPGSYYLTGNVSGVSGKNAIEIAAGHVTLDLNGFTVTGVPGSLAGVRVTGSGRYGMTIRNGTVSGCGEDGVDFGNSVTYAAEQLQVDNNNGVGIRAGFTGHVIACSARTSGLEGIIVGDPSVVDHCTAVTNGGAGIRATAGKCTITNCATELNGGPGIQVSNSCLVMNNQCGPNSGAGILATSINNRIEGNNIQGGATGLQVTGTGNLILRNSVTDAATPFDIAANNRYGQIVNISASGTPAVVGGTAAGVLTTTDPWANFTY